MGSSSVRGAESWLQLLCFSSFSPIYCIHVPILNSFHRQRQIVTEFAGKLRESLGENGGKVSGNFGKVTGVLYSTYVGIPTQVMH